jgi:hypothetical protein
LYAAGARFVFGKEIYIAISTNTQHDSPCLLAGWEIESDGDERLPMRPHHFGISFNRTACADHPKVC